MLFLNSCPTQGTLLKCHYHGQAKLFEIVVLCSEMYIFYIVTNEIFCLVRAGHAQYLIKKAEMFSAEFCC